MKTNEWTYEEMSLKVQVNQKKPKKIGGNTGKYKETKLLQMKQMISMEDVIIVGNMAIKRQTVGNFMGNPTQNQNKKTKV